jgi:cytochrome P450
MNIDYDPFFSAHNEDPYPIYAEMRRSAPVYWAERSKTWVVSRYDDVMSVLKDTTRFSSDAMATVLVGSTPRRSYDGTPGAPRPSVVTSDPPVHTALRDVVNRGFTPRQISAWKPAVEKIVDDCVATMRAKKHFDLVADLTNPFPVMVIANVLGIDPSRYADFRKWATIITQGMNGSKRHLGFVGSGAAAASAEMSKYLAEIIARKTSATGNDLISVLVRAKEGDALTAQEAVNFANLLLFAGSETTTNLIGNAACALFTHPATLACVQANPELIAPTIEETLRWDPPVHYIFRRATQDVAIAGITIPEGSMVTVLIASANRDDTACGHDAAEFDIDRKMSNPHLAFGFGAHFCLGASLARMEATAALQQVIPLLARSHRTNESVAYIDSFQFRGPAALLMEWN